MAQIYTLHSSISSILFSNTFNVAGAIPILHQNVFGAIGVAFLFRFKLGAQKQQKLQSDNIYIFRLYQLIRVCVWHTQKDKTGPAAIEADAETNTGNNRIGSPNLYANIREICGWFLLLNHAIRNKIFANRMKFKNLQICALHQYRKENADPM